MAGHAAGQMASDAVAAADRHGDVTAGNRLNQAGQQLGQGQGQGQGLSPMAAAAQSCCVADRRFPFYGMTTFGFVTTLSHIAKNFDLVTNCTKTYIAASGRSQKMVLGGEGGLGAVPPAWMQGQSPARDLEAKTFPRIWSIIAFCLMVKAFS